MKAKIIRGVVTTVVIAAILGAGIYSMNTQYHFIPMSSKTPETTTEYSTAVQTEIPSQTEPVAIGETATDPSDITPLPSELETSSLEDNSEEGSKPVPAETVTIMSLSYQVDRLEVLHEVSDRVATESMAREGTFIGNKLAPGYTYVMIDLIIQNVSSSSISGRTLNSCWLTTVNDDGSFNLRSEMRYYKGGDPSSRTYYHFSLQPHEAKTFRVGFILQDQYFTSGQTCLLINPRGIDPRQLTGDELRTILLDIY